jgi:hypothetical protein
MSTKLERHSLESDLHTVNESYLEDDKSATTIAASEKYGKSRLYIICTHTERPGV